MAIVRDEWINLSLHGKLDKEEAEAGVKWMYYASNLKEPKVIFIEGPKDFANKFSASVGDSVWAYTSTFINADYKFNFAVMNNLYERGLVPSFDGKIWRLHSGTKAEIVWEGKI